MIAYVTLDMESTLLLEEICDALLEQLARKGSWAILSDLTETDYKRVLACILREPYDESGVGA